MCQFLNPAKNRLYPFLNMLSCHPFPATPHISASFWDVELFPFTLLSSRASRAVFWGFGFLWVLGIGQGPLAHTSHLSCSLTTLTLTLLHIDVCLLPFATNSTWFVCVCAPFQSINWMSRPFAQPGKSRDNHKKKKRRNWNWKMQTKTLNAFGQLAKCSFIRSSKCCGNFRGHELDLCASAFGRFNFPSTKSL